MSNQNNIIELYENTNQMLNASIDKITVALIEKRKTVDKAQSIVVTGCSPLAGATSTSISVAIAMAATGRKTLLVDCDVRKSFQYKKINDNIRKGLADFISLRNEKGVKIEDITYQTNIDNLWCVPSGKSEENPTRILCSDNMNRFIDHVESNFEFVIFDFPSISVVPDVQTMFKNDVGIVLVVAIGETKKAQIKDANRLIRPFKEKYYGMIVNKIPFDMYKVHEKNYDYYLLGKDGKQKFEKSRGYRKSLSFKNKKVD